jgi:DNA-binding winged helix-turn-helix (wHTH) protein/alpha-beta hydrolase superfamily lysophospholipase
MPCYQFAEFLIDIDERRLLRNGVDLKLRGKVFDTLCVFVQNAGRLLHKDELLAKVWPDSIVEENNLDHCVSQLRRLLGDSSQQFIETVPRQGYRFVQPARKVGVPERAEPEPAFETPKVPPQIIRSFLTRDGVNIAYSRCGSGPPLVKAANWLNHLEFEWHSPIWAHWVAAFTKHHTLYRYDERGNGLSDWNVNDFSFDAWVRDFDQLIETINVQKFAILGISQGGAVAISYAARHPERVSKLILYGSFARGWFARDMPGEIERRNALLTLVKHGWGKDNPAFRQLWTTIFMPDATREEVEWFNELQRRTTSPENACELLRAGGKINVVDLLPLVQCPTLVLHCKNDSAVPVSEGRLLASRISNTKFLELPSRNHLVTPHEAAWPMFLDAVTEFMEWENTQTALSRHLARTSRLAM